MIQKSLRSAPAQLLLFGSFLFLVLACGPRHRLKVELDRSIGLPVEDFVKSEGKPLRVDLLQDGGKRYVFERRAVRREAMPPYAPPLPANLTPVTPPAFPQPTPNLNLDWTPRPEPLDTPNTQALEVSERTLSCWLVLEVDARGIVRAWRTEGSGCP